jgi:hypothetical protein
MGRTLAISWLPVTERAKSTIMALLDLQSRQLKLWTEKKIDRPFGRLTHPLNDFIEGGLSAFLKCLGNRLGALFMGRKF